MTVDHSLAWYVYAVLPAGDPRPVPAGDAILPCAAVETLCAAGLAAVASLVPAHLFTDAAAENGAADPAWVAARAASHHGVVQALHACGTCLPLGFGTLFASAAGVRDWLTRHQAGLRAGLARLEGQDEWGLTLQLDQAVFTDWAARGDAGLAALAEAAARATGGTAFLLGKRFSRARQAAGEAAFPALLAALEQVFAACGARPRAERPAPGVQASWSLLLPHGQTLHACHADAAARWAQAGVSLRLTGPWPPYAFARAALEQDNA